MATPNILRVALRVALLATTVAVAGIAEPLRAQAAPIAASMLVGDVVSEIERSAQSLMSQLEGSVSRQSFAMRQHLSFVLQNTKLLVADSVNLTFDRLNAEQRAAIQNVHTLITSFSIERKATLDDARKTLAVLQATLVTLPGSNKRPFVVAASPAFVLASAMPDASVTVRFEGTRLGSGRPELTMRGNACQLQHAVESGLAFVCPGRAFATRDTGVVPVSGTLRVYNYRTAWERFVGWFSDNAQSFDYTVGVFAVPERLGQYRVRATTLGAQRETRTRSVSNGHRNNHCSGDTYLVWSASADNADPAGRWYVDVTSIRLNEVSRSTNSVNNGVFNVTPDGFQFGGVARNNGGCGPRIPFSSDRAWYDGRGWIELRADFVEYRDRETTDEHEIGTGSLSWGKDVVHALPASTAGYLVEVEQIDGRHAVVSGTRAGETQVQPWFGVAFTPANGRLVIQPKPIDAALQ